MVHVYSGMECMEVEGARAMALEHDIPVIQVDLGRRGDVELLRLSTAECALRGIERLNATDSENVDGEPVEGDRGGKGRSHGAGQKKKCVIS